jgi:hypothetical protein
MTHTSAISPVLAWHMPAASRIPRIVALSDWLTLQPSVSIANLFNLTFILTAMRPCL